MCDFCTWQEPEPLSHKYHQLALQNTYSQLFHFILVSIGFDFDWQKSANNRNLKFVSLSRTPRMSRAGMPAPQTLKIQHPSILLLYNLPSSTCSFYFMIQNDCSTFIHNTSTVQAGVEGKKKGVSLSTVPWSCTYYFKIIPHGHTCLQVSLENMAFILGGHVPTWALGTLLLKMKGGIGYWAQLAVSATGLF